MKKMVTKESKDYADGYFVATTPERVDKTGKVRQIGVKTKYGDKYRHYTLTIIDNN